MYFGLLVSVVLHATLLGWTIVSIQSTPELKAPEVEPIAVEMITPSELTRLTRGSRRATLKDARAKESPETEATPKETSRPRPPVAQPPPPPPPPAPEPPAPAPEPAQQKPAEAPPPPPPPPASAPTPEPDRAALEQKLADLALQQAEEAKRQAQAKAETESKAKAEAEAKARAEAEARAKAEAEAKAKADAEAKRKAEEKRKADLKRKQEEKRREAARLKKTAEEKAKAKFDADRLAALLDKSPDPRAPAPAAPQPSTDTHAKGPVLGAREGQDSTLSASQRGWLAKLLGDAVGRCWNVMAGVAGVERLVIKVQVRLNRDGTIVGAPKVTNSDGTPLFALAADSTVRAMIECAPYNLPQDMYTDGWEYIEFAFRPPQ